MDFSSNRSRIPALSAVKPSNKTLSSASESMFSSKSDTSYRYGLFSTARKSASVSRTNKYSNCHSAISSKQSKGLFSQTPKTDRVSVYAASASGRRSSIVGDRNRQKDCRPLAEPKYQNDCIAKLIRFLTENGYSSPIPSKFLKSPSKQDVIRVFEFLFSQFDPTLVVTPIEANVPELMVQFGYPYYITKSTLVAVAGRHALGNLLGMFEFLVDLAKSSNDFFADEEDLICAPFVADEVFIKSHIMNIVSEDIEDVEPFFKDMAYKKLGDNEEERDRLMEALNEDTAMLENVEKDIEYYNAMQARIVQFENAFEEYEKYNSCMEVRNLKDAEELAADEEEILTLQKTKAMTCEEEKALEIIIKDQPYQIADIQTEQDKQLQIEMETNETRLLSRKVKHEINQLASELASLKTSITKSNSNFVSATNAEMINLNSHPIKKCTPWVIEKLQSTDLQDILDCLSRPDAINNIDETTKRANKCMNGFVNYFIETSVGLSAKLARIKENNKQHDASVFDKERELEELQEQLPSAEKDLREFKKHNEMEKKLMIETNEGYRKMIEEFTLSATESSKEYENRLSRAEQALTHEKEATQALIEQDQIGRTKRKEAFSRVTQNFYKIVCTIEEAEKRKIADLEEKVAGAEAARKRLQQKVLQTKST